jgi:CheY-like chemotaxis protein
MNTSDVVEAERMPLRTKDHPLRVLIADDHALFRDGLRRLLEDAGLKVIGQAGDGKEAVALTQRLEPDLLLLDLSMPKHSALAAFISRPWRAGNTGLFGYGKAACISLQVS